LEGVDGNQLGETDGAGKYYSWGVTLGEIVIALGKIEMSYKRHTITMGLMRGSGLK